MTKQPCSQQSISRNLLVISLVLLLPAYLSAQEDTDLDLAGIARRQANPARVRLNNDRQGTGIFRPSVDGRCRISLRCSTRKGASLQLKQIDSSGNVVLQMSWKRSNDTDASPLVINGSELSKSIF